MSSLPEPISDQSLADSISESDGLDLDDLNSDNQGVVEAGIPPDLESEESNIHAEDEAFGMDDFTEAFAGQTEPDESDSSEEIPAVEESVSPTKSSFSSENSGKDLIDGDVAQFRKTLKDLSQQLEIDRLAFLYGKMKDEGCELPGLDKISADIKGEQNLHPIGDRDSYSKTPFARLQGWISGFSFGISRRAKKFDQF